MNKRIIMPKSNHREKVDRKAYWDKVWMIFVIAVLLSIIGYSIYIQILHHT